MDFYEIQMTIANVIIAFIFGVSIGSFTNNWAYRLARGKSVMKGRSACTTCGHTLGVPDLIPLFSYMFLRGKCRHCKARIAPRYFIVELVSGILYGLLAYRIHPVNDTLEFVRWAVLIMFLTTLALQDMETMELSGSIMLMILIWGIALIYWAPEGIMNRLISPFAISVPVYVLSIILDKVMGMETMGGGDIKLIFVLGFHLPVSHMLLMLLISCIIGIVISLASGGSDDVGEQVEDENGKEHFVFPFGPAICIASFIVALWGTPLIELWNNLIKSFIGQ